MKTRKYQLRRRAESQEKTRSRIVDAIIGLHETLGPRATTVSAIAERAGVQRLTVYRHFPDEVALFNACSSRWLNEHPLPDPATWRSEPEWRGRCQALLASLYAYFRRNQRMLASVFRDADIPSMQAPIQAFTAYLDQMQRDLIKVTEPRLAKNKAFVQTINHGLSFATWQSLSEGFNDTDMVALVMAWLGGIVADVDRTKHLANRHQPNQSGTRTR